MWTHVHQKCRPAPAVKVELASPKGQLWIRGTGGTVPFPYRGWTEGRTLPPPLKQTRITPPLISRPQKDARDPRTS